VDGVAVVQRVERRGDAWLYDLRVPDACGKCRFRTAPYVTA